MTDWISTPTTPPGQMISRRPGQLEEPRSESWAMEWLSDLLHELCGETGLTEDCPARRDDAKGRVQ